MLVLNQDIWFGHAQPVTAFEPLASGTCSPRLSTFLLSFPSLYLILEPRTHLWPVSPLHSSSGIPGRTKWSAAGRRNNMGKGSEVARSLVSQRN